ncbi:YfiT family bacillithiol transferase [Tenacibaculum xiamenense]|uniref:YfiT family bacillithiol transferase n=1 Tax=Tenacibaculum xiamenense TaxID=1261553 RepID=UPI0038953474
MNDVRYPIGKFEIPQIIDREIIEKWISIIEEFPERINAITSKLDEEQLNTQYRENGWTIRQVIHHCADSHHNSYTRLKWTLTEDSPIIKAYYEERWAELFDSKNAPIHLSISYLKALHSKWVYLLKHLSKKQLSRSFIHPETNSTISLKENIGLYAWHCNHHYAHVENLLKRKKWL